MKTRLLSIQYTAVIALGSILAVSCAVTRSRVAKTSPKYAGPLQPDPSLGAIAGGSVVRHEAAKSFCGTSGILSTLDGSLEILAVRSGRVWAFNQMDAFSDATRKIDLKLPVGTIALVPSLNGWAVGYGSVSSLPPGEIPPSSAILKWNPYGIGTEELQPGIGLGHANLTVQELRSDGSASLEFCARLTDNTFSRPWWAFADYQVLALGKRTPPEACENLLKDPGFENQIVAKDDQEGYDDLESSDWSHTGTVYVMGISAKDKSSSYPRNSSQFVDLHETVATIRQSNLQLVAAKKYRLSFQQMTWVGSGGKVKFRLLRQNPGPENEVVFEKEFVIPAIAGQSQSVPGGLDLPPTANRPDGSYKVEFLFDSPDQQLVADLDDIVLSCVNSP